MMCLKSLKKISFFCPPLLRIDTLVHSRRRLLKGRTSLLQLIPFLIFGRRCKVVGNPQSLFSVQVISPRKCLLRPNSSTKSTRDGSPLWRKLLTPRRSSSAVPWTCLSLSSQNLNSILSNVRDLLIIILKLRGLISLGSSSSLSKSFWLFYPRDLTQELLQNSLVTSSSTLSTMLSSKMSSPKKEDPKSSRSFQSVKSLLDPQKLSVLSKL